MKADCILKAQDTKEVLTYITHRVGRLASLYSIPEWSIEKSLNLAEWIFDNYAFETTEVVDRVLKNPPVTDKVWRLTPDVIREWMEIELDREAQKREIELHNLKKEIPDNDVDLLLTEALKDSPAPRPILPLTAEEIKLEGQEKPYHKPYSTNHVDEVRILSEKKMQYGRECTDLLTGKRLPGSPSFDEWLILNDNPYNI